MLTGLTATTNAGTLANGNGSIKFDINGTPNSDGYAYFDINLGGQSCSFYVNVLNTIDTPNMEGDFIIYETVDATIGSIGSRVYDTILYNQINAEITIVTGSNPFEYEMKQINRPQNTDWVNTITDLSTWYSTISYVNDSFRWASIGTYKGVIYNKDSFRIEYTYGGYDGVYDVYQIWKRK